MQIYSRSCADDGVYLGSANKDFILMCTSLSGYPADGRIYLYKLATKTKFFYKSEVGLCVLAGQIFKQALALANGL